MALVLRNVYNWYNYAFNEYSDPRVISYPLLGSPLPVIGIMTLYLWFVNNSGRKFMQHRKPYNCTTAINLYNIGQVFLNLYIGVTAFRHSYGRGDFSYKCQEVKYDETPAMKKLVLMSYLYFITKIIDLMDTVFFILKKKYSQISFLHTYHHAGMVFATYLFNKFWSGSHPTLLGIINSFVHVIMYSYYFLTAFKPELKQSIWWKKHITQIQLLQFLVLIFHFGLPIFDPSCNFPKIVLGSIMVQNLFMFILFSDFYIKAYVKKKPKKAVKDNNEFFNKE